MLAYLDGILEPEDAAEIGKKIAESKVATELLHRTRDVMRRLRLAAPALTDHGPGLDANTVAEYLDNTLHGDRVPDFEKVCLDSDIHLAEVASCHQILTLVLGEAAEIDPSSRQRMYGLPAVSPSTPEAPVAPPIAATTVPSGDGQGSAAPPVEPPPMAGRQKPEIPEYLREPRRPRRFLPAAAVLLLALCFAVVVLTALGQFEPGTPLGDVAVRMGLVKPPAEVAAAPEAGGSPEAGPTSVTSTGIDDPPSGDPPPDVVPPGIVPPEVVPPGVTPPDNVVDPPIDPVVPLPPADPNDLPPVAPLPPDSPGPVDPPTTPTDLPPLVPPNDPTDPTVNPPVSPPAVPPTAPVPPAPQRMGELTSERQVLLRGSPGADSGTSWQRVAPRGIVSSRQSLLSLPTFRPLLTLSGAGVTVQLIDGTLCELLSADDQGFSGMSVDYGRAILRTAGEANVSFRLRLGEQTGVITFVDPGAMAALHVDRDPVPGVDPQAEPAPVVADLYAAVGRIRWEVDGSSTTLEAGTGVPLDVDPLPDPVAVEQMPAWIAGGESVPFDLGPQASNILEKELQADARLGLLELANHRRKEVAWLASRCLGHIGEFDSLVTLLDDATEKQIWPDCIRELREAVSRGASVAADVHRAMAKRYTTEADGLHRMLWGYSEQDLRDGEAGKLIDALSHKELALRVVSFQNLTELTGWKLYYEPEEPEAKRRQPAQKWAERFESGELLARVVELRKAASALPPPPADDGNQP